LLLSDSPEVAKEGGGKLNGTADPSLYEKMKTCNAKGFKDVYLDKD